MVHDKGYVLGFMAGELLLTSSLEECVFIRPRELAAMQAAGLNVKVNTRLMADKARADALEARAEQLLAEFVPQADRVYQTVSNE